VLQTLETHQRFMRNRRALYELLGRRPHTALLTVAMTALFAIWDFTAPGEIIVAIFYSFSVAVSGASRSRSFLWLTTIICIGLTYAGLALGPQPAAPVLEQLYINRSFVAGCLIMIAVIVRQRIHMLDDMENARDLQFRQNEILRDTDAKLRRLNEELENRVAQEVKQRLETERMLHQAQKMEAVGQLTGGLAHDFNNVLTTIIANLELVANRTVAEDPRRRFAENALRGAEQGNVLIKRLLSFARHQRLEPKMLDVNRVIETVAALAHPVLSETIEFSIKIAADLWPCCVDQAELESALLNLVINARDAMDGNGRIVLSAENTSIAADVPDLVHGDYVCLSVRDTGCGMSPEVSARVFEPFFTTKDPGKGSGLGLSMVYGFAKQSGGAARIESAPGRGTAVRLYLSRATASVEQSSPQG
jgi:signal transduction histidine kinase